MKMRFMTLQAKEGLILFEQVVGYRPVGIVAGQTIFCHRCMFENKGASLVRMTRKTEIVQPLIGFQILHQRTMMLMTTAAFHLSLPHGVVGRIIGFDLDVPVAAHAQIRITFFQTFALVNGMALGAGYLTQGVVA
jgi:hypothetical protein